MQKVWDPEIVARAAHLHLHARSLVWGYRFGAHRSPKIARSIEFAEHKEYAPGDPVRDIDWRIYARTERLLVRRQQADTELSVIFVLDASADMALGFQSYPDWEQSHFGRAAILVASLAMIAQRRGERVGLLIMGGEGHDVHWLRPKSHKNQLVHMLSIISSVKPAGRASIKEGLSFLNERVPRRSMVFLMSDCMEEPRVWGPALRTLAAQKLDLRVVHVFSQREYDFSFSEIGKFLSSEYTSSVSLDPKTCREDFVQIVEEYKKELQSWCGQSGALYIPVPLEDGLEQAFMHMIKGKR